VPVRARGTGPSTTPLCATGGVRVAPDRLTGIESIAADRSAVTVRSGTVLHDLATALHHHGLALHNLGDIDVQTVAGAISTGTHGTGASLGNLATAVRALRLVVADGTIVETDAAHDAELFEAARLSIGALGVITAVTLTVVPTYRLHERTWFTPGDEVLPELPVHIAATRHYEFFWYPHRDLAAHKALAHTDAPPDALPDRKRERIDHWHRVLPSRRDVRFNEMEYSVPADAGPACFDAVRACMRAGWQHVEWPVEYRTVAADEIWLSPHHGRPSVTISIHQGAELECEPVFAACEPILLEHGGRPHWGKVHGLATSGRDDLAGRYPRWRDWWRVRDERDPERRFLNAHLDSLRG
jgi:FAD/FMN-containing dehydrogenase